MVTLQEIEEFRKLMENYEKGLSIENDSMNNESHERSDYLKMREKLKHQASKEVKQQVKQEIKEDLKKELRQKYIRN